MQLGRLHRLAALVLAVTFLAASIGAYAGHSDDGCQVEMHCFACHWAFANAAAAISLPAALEMRQEPAGAVAALVSELPCDPLYAEVASRGPPLG